jgi:hypothetical protein
MVALPFLTLTSLRIRHLRWILASERERERERDEFETIFTYKQEEYEASSTPYKKKPPQAHPLATLPPLPISSCG